MRWCTLPPLADYEARTQGAFVEKKVSSVTFHYRNADPVFGVFQGERQSSRVLWQLVYWSTSESTAKECQAMLESMQESLPIDVLVVSSPLFLYHRRSVDSHPFCVVHRERKTLKFVLLTPTRERSSSVSSTNTPKLSSVCARETTRLTKTWWASLSYFASLLFYR